MRSFALATGSSGNCFFVESKEGTRILIDLGLPFSKIEKILNQKGVDVNSINAVLITHEHSDHVIGLKTFMSRVIDCPVYITKGSFEEVTGLKIKDCSKNFNIVKHHDFFNILDFKIFVLEKPHDAKEAVSYILNDGEKKLGIFTDLGHVNDEIMHAIKTLDYIYIEANYCEEFVKDKSREFSSVYLNRLMSDFGHLSINQCINVLTQTANNFQKVVLSHISENTNSYENTYLKVRKGLDRLAKKPEIYVGFQGEPTDWIE